MKCPKCGYISFDYNIVCPKCNKDIGSQQTIMNLPSFRPEPPSLLGVLTGEANESNIGFDSSGIMGVSNDDIDVSLDDSTSIDTETGSIDFDEDQELDISLGESDEIEIPGDASIGDEETISDSSLEDEGGEISFDLDEAASLEPEQDTASFEDLSDVEESAISLDEISLNEGEPAELDMGVAETSLDNDVGGLEEEELNFDDISLDEGEPADLDMEDAETSLDNDFGGLEEAELNLGDVSLDEGEPVDLDMEDAGISLDKDAGGLEEAELNLDGISLDEDTELEESISTGDELDLGSLSMDTDEKPQEDSGEIELHIDDLKINETGELEIGTDVPAIEPDDDSSLDLGDLSIDTPQTGEEKSWGDDIGSDSLEIDLDALVSDYDENSQKKSEFDPDEESLDLDDLDLDFDLDDSEDK